jgi:hypothetical protein
VRSQQPNRVGTLKKSNDDRRINAFFAATAADPKRRAALKFNLVDQICQASGGPCQCTGKPMKAAHVGMGIRSADFNALAERECPGSIPLTIAKDKGTLSFATRSVGQPIDDGLD